MIPTGWNGGYRTKNSHDFSLLKPAIKSNILPFILAKRLIGWQYEIITAILEQESQYLDLCCHCWFVVIVKVRTHIRHDFICICILYQRIPTASCSISANDSKFGLWIQYYWWLYHWIFQNECVCHYFYLIHYTLHYTVKTCKVTICCDRSQLS